MIISISEYFVNPLGLNIAMIYKNGYLYIFCNEFQPKLVNYIIATNNVT